MSVSREMLLDELKDLLRLTAFEQAVATVRRAQAASTPIAAELAANAEKAGERITLLGQSVRQIGGVPDVVGPFLGKAGAFLQSQFNQVQTLQGALLGDLALEHQLRDRARYARTLAVTLGEQSVIPLLDRLDTAHSETIAWLEQRLAEVGTTGTSALRATPVQAVVGQLRNLYGAPLGVAAAGVNRLGGLLSRGVNAAPDVLSQAVDTVEQAAGAVKDEVVDLTDRAGDAAGTAAQAATGAAQQAAGTVTQVAQDAAETVTDTAQDAAETVTDTAQDAAGSVGTAAQTAADATSSAADSAGTAAEQAAQVTREVLEQTGDDLGDDVKHPFAGYERLTGDSIIRHVGDSEDVDELRTLLAFEQAHKARKGVLSAAQTRLSELSASV